MLNVRHKRRAYLSPHLYGKWRQGMSLDKMIEELHAIPGATIECTHPQADRVALPTIVICGVCNMPLQVKNS
ncbi:MAG: hypothetical protein EBY03_08760 [Actinobacteria bacterium]|nr:hypothetical protein [Actinomycetota bacterium]